MNWSTIQHPLEDNNLESDLMTFSVGNMNISLDRNTLKARCFSEYRRETPETSFEIIDIKQLEEDITYTRSEMKSNNIEQNSWLEDAYTINEKLKQSEDRCQISEDELPNTKSDLNVLKDNLNLFESHYNGSNNRCLHCNCMASHIEKYKKEIQDLKIKLQQSQKREQELRILFDRHQRQQIVEISDLDETKHLQHFENESNSRVIPDEKDKVTKALFFKSSNNYLIHILENKCTELTKEIESMQEQLEISKEDFEKEHHNRVKFLHIIQILHMKIKHLQSENLFLKHQISAIHSDFLKERQDKNILKQNLDYKKLPVKGLLSYRTDCNLPSNVEPDGV